MSVRKCSQAMCDQTTCDKPAEYFYTWWPTGAQLDVCRPHVRGVVRVATAVGVKVNLQRIDSHEAKEKVLRAAFVLWSAHPFDTNNDEYRALMEAVEHAAHTEAEALRIAAELINEEDGPNLAL